MSKILIVAEHLDGQLNTATARCVSCARAIKPDAIDVLVLADAPDTVAAEAAKLDGVSKVLTAKIPMRASASGASSAARMPVSSKANGPCSLSARQPPSTFGAGGAASCGHTIDSSSAVRDTETKPGASSTPAGTGASAGNRATA